MRFIRALREACSEEDYVPIYEVAGGGEVRLGCNCFVSGSASVACTSFGALHEACSEGGQVRYHGLVAAVMYQLRKFRLH